MTGGKKVNFTHYASGQVKTATPEGGQAIAMEYNLQGHRTKLTDPDAGVITSRYDGWGQLVQEKQKIHITADSIVTAYSYSPSGLLNNKLRNGEYTNYRYDTSHRLSSISIAGKHAQGFAYDSYDRIIQSNDTVDGKVFVRKTEYDALGNVYRETYPGDYYTVNQYDKYGYLTTVTDKNGSNIWKVVESNARGQLTKTQSGNKETFFGFNDKGFLTSINTPGIMNRSYVFNGKGNLVSRKDGITNYKDSLTYDALNRLTNWNIYQGNSQVQSNSMMYNSSTGNIQSRSDLSNYTMNYGENGKPHALTSISGIPGGFPTDNQNITYTDFKKVKTITEGTKNYNLTYGVDEQRLKSVYKVNNVIQKTRYYMGNYEEEIIGGNTKRIHYLSGGNGLAAIYVQNNSTETLYYAHADYQGSLIALSLADGTVKERYAYDPWGNRRNPSNWTQKDTRTALLFNRGYTMHEHLPEFSLINMNGRVYDPLTAMFLSPDPYVQAPGDWLNYNRYSYCLNNPLKYTDPDGECIFMAIFLGAMINTAIQGASGNIGGEGSFFKAIGIGALSGAAGFGAGNFVSSALGTATSLGGSIFNGAATGAAGGFAGGFVGGAGNAWVGGASFGDGFKQGIIGAGIGALAGGLIGGISGGLQFQRQEALFRAAEKEMGFEQGKPLPANDQTLDRFTDYWYKSRNSEPFDKVIDYTYDNKPQSAINHFAGNPKATAITVPQMGVNGKSTGFSSIFFNDPAFASSRSLYLAIGHELVHVQQYAYLAGRTVSFLNSARAVMEVGAYGWEYNSGNQFSIFDVKSWQGAKGYGSFVTNNSTIANNLLYNSTIGLPTVIPVFDPIVPPLIPFLKIR